MIPKGLQHHHFLKAIREIDTHGVPVSRASYRYDLLLHGKSYPPKYVISIATKIASGSELTPERFNAVEAREYFVKNGFTIIVKSAGHRRAIGRIADEDEESRFAEGAEKYRVHRSLERDPSVVKKAKEYRLSQGQDLRCDVCDLSFFEQYGKIGEGYIEAHHTVPISILRGEKRTKISDIALVCSNCHRMIHRSKPMLSVSALREIVKLNRNGVTG